MKKVLSLLIIGILLTSCNFNAKKGSIGEVDLNGKKAYVYPFGKEHQVVGHWTSSKFEVIHDPDCPCLNTKLTKLEVDSLIIYTKTK